MSTKDTWLSFKWATGAFNPTAFQTRMRRRRGKLGKLEILHAKATVLVFQWIQRNFQGEGKLVGGWAPLKKNPRQGQQGRGRILQDRGYLRNHWKMYWSARRGIVESAMPYAAVHNYGSREKHIPKRQILPTPKQIQPRLQKLFRHHIRVGIK